METELTLPAEVTEHFAKANKLHAYVQESLGEATKHALETGRELLAAKKAIPHGRWEGKCTKLFDGSLRLAQFYMRFATDFGQLKSAEKPALLMLEGTLDGAAKAARKAAAEAGGKQPPKPPPGPNKTLGKSESRQRTAQKPPKKLDREAYYQQWNEAIGPLVRLVDKIAEGLGERHDPRQVAIQDRLNEATEEMMAWMGVK